MSGRKAYRDGAFVFEHLGGADRDNVQPNGVDIKLRRVLKPKSPGYIGEEEKEVGDRREVEPGESSDIATNYIYDLGFGAYIVEYEEVISIPDGHIGFVYPRSTLMRNGCMLFSAVWDSGYRGRGEGLLVVFSPSITIEKRAPIGQMVFARASHEDSYEGSYQNERLEEYE